jgi:hypothetical protein
MEAQATVQPIEGYTYQPEPPNYYPLSLRQDHDGTSTLRNNSIKRRRIATSRGNVYEDARRNLYRWARW